jgi:hypothetical protein
VGDNLSAMIVALVAVGGLAGIMRWAFRPSHRSVSPLIDASDSPELGLLDVIATGVGRAGAMELRARLGDAGIRSSMSRRRDGEMDVLVFRADVERARALLN